MICSIVGMTFNDKKTPFIYFFEGFTDNLLVVEALEYIFEQKLRNN